MSGLFATELFGAYEWNLRRITSSINYDLEILPAFFR
jgi:hypothetical protein